MSERASRVPAVGIGASAGGVDALERLFRHMPSDTGLAFVVVTHLAPDRHSLLPEIVRRFTDMEVHSVRETALEGLVSVNEELQSTNEELEASKEQLQLLNEELHTVNAEPSHKVDALDQSNSDLHNLFESTRSPPSYWTAAC